MQCCFYIRGNEEQCNLGFQMYSVMSIACDLLLLLFSSIVSLINNGDQLTRHNVESQGNSIYQIQCSCHIWGNEKQTSKQFRLLDKQCNVSCLSFFVTPFFKHIQGWVRLPKRMNFWKSSKGGVLFSKNLYRRFWTFTQGFKEGFSEKKFSI